MSQKLELLEALQPILDFLGESSIDSSLQPALQKMFPLHNPTMKEIKKLVLEGITSGWLCPRAGKDLTYGRLTKANVNTNNFGIDTVDMVGSGPGHTHPNGEVDLCFTVEGNPLFDGNPEGWTVYEKDTWHIPTVSGGRMAILYFLPEGAIAFGPKPD